jgi:hypothetical protein
VPQRPQRRPLLPRMRCQRRLDTQRAELDFSGLDAPARRRRAGSPADTGEPRRASHDTAGNCPRPQPCQGPSSRTRCANFRALRRCHLRRARVFPGQRFRWRHVLRQPRPPFAPAPFSRPQSHRHRRLRGNRRHRIPSPEPPFDARQRQCCRVWIHHGRIQFCAAQQPKRDCGF